PAALRNREGEAADAAGQHVGPVVAERPTDRALVRLARALLTLADAAPVEAGEAAVAVVAQRLPVQVPVQRRVQLRGVVPAEPRVRLVEVADAAGRLVDQDQASAGGTSVDRDHPRVRDLEVLLGPTSADGTRMALRVDERAVQPAELVPE